MILSRLSLVDTQAYVACEPTGRLEPMSPFIPKHEIFPSLADVLSLVPYSDIWGREFCTCRIVCIVISHARFHARLNGQANGMERD